MNKNEFMEKLKYELGNVDEVTSAEILNDFNEHFEVALNSGKNEEEICRILGDPREIAQEFLHGYGEQRDVQPRQEHAEPEKRKSGFMNWSFGKRETEAHGGQFINRLDAENLGVINFNLMNSELEVVGAEIDHVNIEIDDESKIKFFATTFTDGFFKLTELKPTSCSVSVRVPIGFAGFLNAYTASGDVEVTGFDSLNGLMVKSKSGSVRVYSVIAEDAMLESLSGNAETSLLKAGKLSIKTTSGECSIEETVSLRQFLVGTASGNVSMLKCAGKEGINISAASGDIEAEECIGNVKAGTGSGDISFCSHDGTVWANTGSGDIEISTTEITCDTHFSSGSGDISVECGSLNAGIRVSTASGDVDLSIEQVHGDIYAKTASGDMEIGLGEGSPVRILTKTGPSGSVHSDFSGRSQQDENTLHTVKLETISGDISISSV